ncbi:MAG: 60S ribosomal protein L38 [Caldisphaeraceae archaeon]|nr:60S ribosomal protein L38 [Caldisphaeraceae archaeon]MEB3691654.1 60S ribosomal protein L38 [Caldisphaeraceae archaeon]MEB3798042.1 60S ribosomal protein L38 [Caldisphaeraceae archaeon]
MPIEVYSFDELLRLSEKAIECRIKRNVRKGTAKIKVRTKKYLYTYKVALDELEDTLKKLNCKGLVDIDKLVSKKPKKAKVAEEKPTERGKETVAETAQEAEKEQQKAEVAEESKNSSS